MTWKLIADDVDDTVQRLTATRDGRPQTVSELLAGLRAEADLRAAWNQALAQSTFAGFRWELPPLTRDRLARPFECVLVEDLYLGTRAPDRGPFGRLFDDGPIVVFDNLGGDARMIVPCPHADDDAAYTHLAAFVRRAPAAQQHALWRRVAEEVESVVGDVPRWLSTAGGGVAWLHVRLDRRPKYYRHGPYRAP